MLKNYLTISLRGLKKNPGYTMINIVGLAIGIACCLLLFLHIQDELTADNFHADADRIYRLVETHVTPEDGGVRFATTAGPVAAALSDTYPDVEATVRVLNLFRPSIRRGAQGFYEADYLMTEPSFLDVFDFEVVRGDAVAALTEPGQVTLTESAVRKYFGDEDPMGQTLSVSAFGDMTVTAILRDPPHNSHLDFSMLFSIATAKRAFSQWDAYVDNWHPNDRTFSTYIRLKRGARVETVESGVNRLFALHQDEQTPGPQSASLQPMTDIYFGSTDIVTSFGVRQGERSYLYIFTAIALFIVVIACINYMNLATARSMRRAREVGLRKSIGAYRSQLVWQFLSEAVLTTLLALVIALGLVQLALPAFNALVHKELGLELLESGPMIASLVAIVIVVGVVAGSYPAFYLAGFRPAQVLKGSIRVQGHTSVMRRALVVAQFTLSIAMIIGTLVAADQLEFVREKHLGFDDTQKLVFDINSGAVRNNAEVIRNSFLENAAVRSVSVTSRVPGDWKQINEIGVVAEGTTDPRSATFIGVDAEFLTTFGVALLDGRGFDADRSSDSAAVLVNQTAARAFGWVDPVGKRIQVPRSVIGATQSDIQFEATVIGVVEDFHFKSLHENIRPLVLGWISTPITGSDYITASVTTANIAGTVAALSEIVRAIDPQSPVEYNFLDQRIQDFYTQDEQVGRLFTVAAGLAILVACLGLFGLAAFTAEQRTKEIGVRKVLGASVGGIITLMSTDFLKLVCVAFVLAAPLAYFAMGQWLEEFAYRATISARTFLVAGGLALAVAMITVSYQSIKAAVADPVRSLRYE